MTTLATLCQTFGQLTGVSLDLTQGAARLDIGTQGPWWLEADSAYRVLTIYHTLGAARQEDYGHWLALNSRLDLLGGAWLAHHQPSDTTRLCLLQEVARLDGEGLVNLLDNLQQVRAALPMPAESVVPPLSSHHVHV